MLVLELSKIKLSPNLIAFINQTIHFYLLLKQMEVMMYYVGYDEEVLVIGGLLCTGI
jgi:hypothetical protein